MYGFVQGVSRAQVSFLKGDVLGLVSNDLGYTM